MSVPKTKEKVDVKKKKEVTTVGVYLDRKCSVKSNYFFPENARTNGKTTCKNTNVFTTMDVFRKGVMADHYKGENNTDTGVDYHSKNKKNPAFY